ncbi:MAG: ABC transporter substrate-binding protein [Lachnoclostridium sp.]|jgi:peptide/nickel transport system substrate-binding protein|nr:ABC transporter substrate-binding protein [Lachnoclostridium sp.]
MKRHSFMLVFFLLMLIVLSGCKDNTAVEESAEPKSSAITSGGSVTVGISQDLDSLDPHVTMYAGTREVLFNIYEGLVKPTPEGELEAAIAEEFQISEDAKTYTFTLRQGLTFHDGSKVTADDVKYSIERYADLQGEESAFSILEEVNVINDSVVEVKLKEGNTEFLAELTLAVLPKDNKDPAKTPIGTGPFKITEFVPGQKLITARFSDYRKADLPYLDQVTFKIITNGDAAFAELQGGSIDVLQYLTVDQIPPLEEQYNIVEGSVNYVHGLFLNNDFEPFKNLKVRQAICYAVDRDAINDFLFNRKSHIIQTHMLPGITKYYNKDTEKAYTKNIEKAKELLKEGGYENGFDLEIIVPDNYPGHQAVAEVIVEQLKEVGIRVKIKQMEFTSWVSDVYGNREFESTVVAVDGTLAPNSWFEKNVSTADKNFTNYKNAEYDRVFSEAQKTIDEDEKVALYYRLQEILTEDAASVYIQDPANLIAVNKKITGYRCYPVAAQDMSEVGFVGA